MDKLAIPFLVVMLACSYGIARMTWRLLVSGALRASQAALGSSPALGCMAFGMCGMPVFALAPPVVLVPAVFFLVLTRRSLYRPGTSPLTQRVLALCTVTWFSYWGYETLLQAWMGTVDAPIRIDMALTGPLVYFVSVVGLAVSELGSPNLPEIGGRSTLWASDCKRCGSWFFAMAEPDETSLVPQPAPPLRCPVCHHGIEMEVPAGCRPDTVKLARSEPCPVCRRPARPRTLDVSVYGARITCALPDGCGTFSINVVAEAELTKFTPDQREMLARALQAAAHKGEPISIRTREDIEAAIASVDP